MLLCVGMAVQCAGPSAMLATQVGVIRRLRNGHGRVLGISEKVEAWRLACALLERTDIHGPVCQRDAPALVD